MKPGDATRLADLAQLMLDHKLGQLRRASEDLERTRMQLKAINAAGMPADLPPLIGGKVALVYDRWADVRRSELNLVISRQTASWMDTRVAAQTAFGRLQALQGLARRLEKGR